MKFSFFSAFLVDQIYSGEYKKPRANIKMCVYVCALDCCVSYCRLIWIDNVCVFVICEKSQKMGLKMINLENVGWDRKTHRRFVRSFPRLQLSLILSDSKNNSRSQHSEWVRQSLSVCVSQKDEKVVRSNKTRKGETWLDKTEISFSHSKMTTTYGRDYFCLFL